MPAEQVSPSGISARRRSSTSRHSSRSVSENTVTNSSPPVRASTSVGRRTERQAPECQHPVRQSPFRFVYHKRAHYWSGPGATPTRSIRNRNSNATPIGVFPIPRRSTSARKSTALPRGLTDERRRQDLELVSSEAHQDASVRLIYAPEPSAVRRSAAPWHHSRPTQPTRPGVGISPSAHPVTAAFPEFLPASGTVQPLAHPIDDQHDGETARRTASVRSRVLRVPGRLWRAPQPLAAEPRQ